MHSRRPDGRVPDRTRCWCVLQMIKLLRYCALDDEWFDVSRYRLMSHHVRRDQLRTARPSTHEGAVCANHCTCSLKQWRETMTII